VILRFVDELRIPRFIGGNVKSGLSLTTTTAANVGDLSHRNIFRSSVPNASLDELFNLHCDRLSKLKTAHGEPQPIELSLLGLAMAIDEYLEREGKV
jgi:hypothetical protein